ncbi:MAG: hypothetical protein ACREBF_02975 [Candidatus Micrarchaeales archaeon]
METITKQKQVITQTESRVTYAEAQKMVKENGGKMIEFKDLISAIKNPEQLEKLKGKTFWISNEGKEFKTEKYHKIDFDKEQIVPISEKEFDKLDYKQRAYVWKGKGPVAVYVLYDDYGRRLDVDADDGPGDVARVAFFKPSQSTQNDKIAPETLDEMRASLKVLRTTVNPELLRPFEEAIRSSEQ